VTFSGRWRGSDVVAWQVVARDQRHDRKVKCTTEGVDRPAHPQSQEAVKPTALDLTASVGRGLGRRSKDDK